MERPDAKNRMRASRDMSLMLARCSYAVTQIAFALFALDQQDHVLLALSISSHNRSIRMENLAPFVADTKTVEALAEQDDINGEANDDQPKPSSNQIPPSHGAHDIPDGGLQAWLQVLGSFFLWFNTW